MSFKISKLQGHPKFDSLPVAKILNYPLEPRDYRPFAQCQLCIAQDGLILRMWAFEVNPEEESSIGAALRFGGDRGGLLTAQLYSDGRCLCALDGSSLPREGFHCHPFTGEDLQGEYWGGTITIPHSQLERLWPEGSLDKGALAQGNLYKLCDGKRPHRGSFYPAEFSGPTFDWGRWLGDFEIVSY